MMETRLVRGWLSAEERQLAWLTSRSDVDRPMPTECRVAVVRQLVHDGALVPVAPGYMQRALTSDEILDADELVQFEWIEPQPPSTSYATVGYFSRPDQPGKVYRVWSDTSGSVSGVEEVM